VLTSGSAGRRSMRWHSGAWASGSTERRFGRGDSFATAWRSPSVSSYGPGSKRARGRGGCGTSRTTRGERVNGRHRGATTSRANRDPWPGSASTVVGVNKAHRFGDLGRPGFRGTNAPGVDLVSDGSIHTGTRTLGNGKPIEPFVNRVHSNTADRSGIAERGRARLAVHWRGSRGAGGRRWAGRFT